MKHTITVDVAGEIDMIWVNSGAPRDGLRLVGYRTPGNGTSTLLCCPGDEYSPVYKCEGDKYVHIGGPTLTYDNKDFYTIYRLRENGFRFPEEQHEADARDYADTIRSLREGLHW